MNTAVQNVPWGFALSTSSGVASGAVFAKPLCSSPELGHAALAVPTVLGSFEIAEYAEQSAQLLPQLQGLMQQHALHPSACMGLGVDVGPGGFTSLRTACGLAQGLATAWQVPVLPVCSLMAMLLQCPTSAWQGLAEGEVVWVLSDARLQEVYVAAWAKSTQGWQAVQEPTLWPVPSLATWEAAHVVCDASVAAYLTSNLNPSLCPQVQVQRASAHGVARAAGLPLAQGQGLPPEACQPLYVRERVAQTLAERHHDKPAA
jgi:tRNA threonylcarbamoyladenosine biosynthesis protein TsaB